MSLVPLSTNHSSYLWIFFVAKRRRKLWELIGPISGTWHFIADPGNATVNNGKRPQNISYAWFKGRWVYIVKHFVPHSISGYCRETKQQPNWWLDLALLGFCLVSVYFLCKILIPQRNTHLTSPTGGGIQLPNYHAVRICPFLFLCFVPPSTFYAFWAFDSIALTV